MKFINQKRDLIFFKKQDSLYSVYKKLTSLIKEHRDCEGFGKDTSHKWKPKARRNNYTQVKQILN